MVAIMCVDKNGIHVTLYGCVPDEMSSPWLPDAFTTFTPDGETEHHFALPPGIIDTALALGDVWASTIAPRWATQARRDATLAHRMLGWQAECIDNACHILHGNSGSGGGKGGGRGKGKYYGVASPTDQGAQQWGILKRRRQHLGLLLGLGARVQPRCWGGGRRGGARICRPPVLLQRPICGGSTQMA